MALFEETYGFGVTIPMVVKWGGHPESMAPRWENTGKIFRPKNNHYQYGTLESK